MVEDRRFELLTPCVQGRCSTSWANPPRNSLTCLIITSAKNYATLFLVYIKSLFYINLAQKSKEVQTWLFLAFSTFLAKSLLFFFYINLAQKKQRSPMADTALSIDLCHKLLCFSFLYKPNTKKTKKSKLDSSLLFRLS